jgi:hypothetical protein
MKMTDITNAINYLHSFNDETLTALVNKTLNPEYFIYTANNVTDGLLDYAAYRCVIRRADHLPLQNVWVVVSYLELDNPQEDSIIVRLCYSRGEYESLIDSI